MGEDVVEDCIKNAQSIPVEGIHYLDDIFPVMLDNFRRGVRMGDPTHMGEMDEFFRWKKGDINLWTGYANAGKTTYAMQCALTKSIYDGWKWGIFSPENYPANDFYDDLVEMYCGRWLDNMGESDYVTACNFLNEHFFYVYPEDEHDLNSIHEKFRYLVMKKGIDGVFLDPWNQIDHIQKAYQREDQYLSQQLKDVKRFALHNAISYNIIAHPVKTQRESDKSYPPVDMYDIAGGAMFANKVDQVISYYRPDYHIDKKSPRVQVFLQKVKRKRTGGQVGDFELRLNWSTKRFIDPVSGEAFCNPQKDSMHTNTLDQTRLPYIDKKDDDLIDEMPF
jgi:twinkle protein